MRIDSLLSDNFRLTETQKKALKKLGIENVHDLLLHFPSRYENTADLKSISSLKKGDAAAVHGIITGLKTVKAFRKKIPMGEATLQDETGRIKIIWFHQPYLAKMIAENSSVRVSGKVAERKPTRPNGHSDRPALYFSNPKVEKIEIKELRSGVFLFGGKDRDYPLTPVYPETRGITSNWIYHAVRKLLKLGAAKEVTDSIPEEILKKYKLPSLRSALIWIHSPKKEADSLAARKRFAFEEIFFIQLRKNLDRLAWREHNSFRINKTEEELGDFIGRFPFPLTSAQKKAISHVLEDFRREFPMSRLLEGDVGSGKTAVAAAASYAIINSRPEGRDYGNLQVAYMCPTEILAEQHFQSFIEYFTYTGINIALITGSGCKKFPSKVNPRGATSISRSQLLKWVANGEIPILIGTHTLIQKAVQFKDLALVIIDEQHRFGTSQRQKLREKQGKIPHLLSMTATPIPRTLSLTVYGDLDLSLLDELPAGRKWPITEIVLSQNRNSTYEKVRSEIKEGRQAFVICPRIDEPDPEKELALLAKSAKEEAKKLKEHIFPEFEIGLLHGKLKPSEKDKVMGEFRQGKIDILVATSVVEVGVNVPNATIIVIEGAERFGLAQLHQLRGRVMRSAHTPYCYIFSDSKSKGSIERLKALKSAKSGFELAEYDLLQRGAGELYGRKQWGLSDLAMEALKNIRMVEAARIEARELVEKDPEFEDNPLLKERLSKEKSKIHFE